MSGNILNTLKNAQRCSYNIDIIYTPLKVAISLVRQSCKCSNSFIPPLRVVISTTMTTTLILPTLSSQQLSMILKQQQ